MDALTCLLMDTAKLLKTSITKSLKPYNLTCRQAVALRVMDKDGLSAKSIGDLCSMDKATLSAILDKLIKNGYITCEQNPDDKRENIYSLTDKGMNILPEISTVELSCTTQFLGTLTEDEYNKMIELLHKVSESVS